MYDDLNGKFLPKDARPLPKRVRTMDPHLDHFLVVKNLVDLEHGLESKLTRCIQLTGR